ncbi:hypothetical protein D9611_004545 [Ephemerocybe angulata]|uniref:Major facilitator superfamily (MFS) profile domain-containing protein n=1 Tax=Ephemerocybe angulata TaxID=980116 RepID=A0A8H5BJE1_9AGAR|nr:hypothetical protein D9611_004545 [Tulosesus angulatus]
MNVPSAPIPADSGDAATDNNTPAPYKTPLPVLQLAVLCAVRLMDPVTFTQIFPYINEFLAKLHLVKDESQIGFYSGVVESTFAFFQLISIYHWAKLSEKIGRRPIVIGGTFGLALATLLLGFTSSLWAILLSRALAGLCSGIAAVLHSVLGELTDSTNQHIAFPLYGLFWPLGSILGPIIGGSLANPAEKYPDVFDYSLFRTYPYLLPCLTTGLLAFVTAVVATIFLTETHPSKQPSINTSGAEHISSHRSLNFMSVPEQSQLTILQLLSIPIIRALSVSGASLCFTATAFDSVFVLFCYTSIPEGGLDFNTSTIGYALAIAGTSSIAIQTLILPSLLRHFGHAHLYNFCMSMWPIAYILMPFLNLFAYEPVQLWIAITVLLSVSRVACLAYSVSMVLVKENAPSPYALGQSNGLVMFAMCASRAVAPAFVRSGLFHPGTGSR